MRFVFAIVAFALAAVMIVLGIAQRTVWLEPASTTVGTTVSDDARYVVIDSAALTSFPGSQTITATGSETVFMAYGRSADVAAWVGDDAYAGIRYGAESGELTSKMAAGATEETPATDDSVEKMPPVPTNPAGSDLWLEEFTAQKILTTTINVPEGFSVILASDGTAPAPGEITMSWPADNSTPWVGPLIAGGGLLLLLGLVFYLWGLIHLRRSRGPRRNVPRGPRIPRLARASRPRRLKAGEITGPHHELTRSRVAVLPVILISGLVLSGCTASWLPGLAPSPSATRITPTPDASAVPAAAADVPPPAVTVPQLERIVRKIAVLTKEADASLDGDSVATRFTGPALEQRLANYKIRDAVKDYAAPPAFPASPLTLTLPQQQEASSWPRVVMAVIQNAEDPTVAPTAIVLRQETPRENYLVEYAMQLEAAAQVPDVAPAAIGAPIIAPDSKLLLLPPDELASAYADILMQGEKSPSFALFEAEGDSFRTQVGVEAKKKKKDALPTTASIKFGAAPGTGKTEALATNDSGAIIAVSLKETETVKPIDKGATVSPEGASKALSGVDATAKGITSSYVDQLLFHVPPAGSEEKIVLLGFAQGLISSAELP